MKKQEDVKQVLQRALENLHEECDAPDMQQIAMELRLTLKKFYGIEEADLNGFNIVYHLYNYKNPQRTIAEIVKRISISDSEEETDLFGVLYKAFCNFTGFKPGYGSTLEKFKKELKAYLNSTAGETK